MQNLGAAETALVCLIRRKILRLYRIITVFHISRSVCHDVWITFERANAECRRVWLIVSVAEAAPNAGTVNNMLDQDARAGRGLESLPSRVGLAEVC